MSKSKIEWTDYTINFISGCTKLSQGCKNCYAEKMHKRLNAMGANGYEQPFSEVKFNIDKLLKQMDRLARKTKPLKVFVNSMSDTFHSKIKDGQIIWFLDEMEEYPNYTFQLLTKRYGRLDLFTMLHGLPSNIWLGVSICNNDDLLNASHHLDHTKEQCDNTLFVSFEPLLEELDERLLEWHIEKNFDWIIVGGESGPGARPMNLDWVRKIRDICIKYNRPFFFKQYSAYKNYNYKNNILDGKVWEQFPRGEVACQDQQSKG